MKPMGKMEDAAPVRFTLRPTAAAKKRKRHAGGGGDALSVSVPSAARAAFSSAEELRQESERQDETTSCIRRRVELLEDTHAKVRRLKDEGNTLAEAGRFRAAMGRWQEALVVDPTDATLFELLAQAAMAVYEDFQAIQFARRATELAPTWSDGFHTLARCQLNFGELALALQAIDKTVELNAGVETEEMKADRRDIQKLLVMQQQVLRQRDQEAARTVGADKLQVISCFKHLSLRAKAVADTNDARSTTDPTPPDMKY